LSKTSFFIDISTEKALNFLSALTDASRNDFSTATSIGRVMGYTSLV
jgi:hypothetical protein